MEHDPMSPRQRVAVVTGGGTGIGAGIAAALADDGAHVVLVGRRAEVLDRTAAALNEVRPGAASTFAADVADVGAVRSLVDHLGRSHGTIDVLVNNAGGADRRPIDSLESLVAQWQNTFQVNLISAVLTTAAISPILRSPGGRVIAVSSASAFGRGGNVAYASSKAAMNRWIQTVASELGPRGITANVVVPGFVPDTELYGPDGAGDAYRQRVVPGIAVGRVGTPADIGAVVRFLASPAASWVSGACYVADGGQRIPG